MTDPRVEKLAEVLVDYSIGVSPGDEVLIQGTALAAPLLQAILVRTLEAGGHPFSVVKLPGSDELLFRHANDDQLRHIPAPIRIAYETFDAVINVMSTDNTKALSNVPPSKMVLTSQAERPIFETITRRTAAGEFDWVLALYPTAAYAQDAEMGIAEYSDFVYGACLPSPDDPVGYWKEFSKRQGRIVDWLAGKRAIRVEGPDVDLTMRIDGRSFINCDGRRNMPDGEIFTGPVEESVEGRVRFSYPSTYQGRRIDGVELRFERGKVVEAHASRGEAFVREIIDTDEGARYVGEFAIGTNRGITRATGNTLFDEKIHGSFHMALGAGMPETGSQNRSAIHWDIVCDLKDGGQITVDGERIYENGAFLIDP